MIRSERVVPDLSSASARVSEIVNIAMFSGRKFLARTVAGPSAEQGLLIARDHYERLGGYAPNVRRSEARLLRQLGRSSRTLLRSRIIVAS